MARGRSTGQPHALGYGLEVGFPCDDLVRNPRDLVVKKRVRASAHGEPEVRRFDEPFSGRDGARFTMIPEADTAAFEQGSGIEEDFDCFIRGRDAGAVIVVNAVLPLAEDLVAVRSWRR